MKGLQQDGTLHVGKDGDVFVVSALAGVGVRSGGAGGLA